MLFTEMLRAHALSPENREATRILNIIINSLDVIPAPDGTVRFAFQGDVELLDRLAMWGAGAEDDEDPMDDEDSADHEPDDRDLDKLKVQTSEIELHGEDGAVALELIAA